MLQPKGSNNFYTEFHNRGTKAFGETLVACHKMKPRPKACATSPKSFLST